ncbi:helix-turn-helix domain-containing protein [Ascidiimonas sp. W6]|uniref:helix-turn-helix domain-containing protein n=1 Tax=Ascidiimonas meishanensis TaxID=3128903 RepID=UPI0030EF5A78
MGQFDLLFATVLGVGSLQGVILTFSLVFFKKLHHIANRYLLALSVVLSLLLSNNFIIASGYYVKFPHLIFVVYPAALLIGPFFYLYVLSLLNPKRKFRLYDVLHFVWYLYFLFEHRKFLILAPEYKIKAAEYFFYSDQLLNMAVHPKVVLSRIVMVLYAIASLYILKNKIKQQKNWSSSGNLLYLNKFKWIGYLYLGYTILFMLGHLYSFFFKMTIARYEVYNHLLNSVIILFLSIIALNQPERLIFSITPNNGSKKTNESNGLVIYNLKKFMQDSKPYLNPDLKLHDLAGLMNTSSHVLSTLINTELKVNFFEFVNQYRVEEFKNRVASGDNKRLTLLAIAFDVGFNSKATFNRIFKKNTGMSPSEYLKQLK